MYARKNDNRMPKGLDDLKPYLAGRPGAFACPVSGKPYVLNPAVSGGSMTELRRAQGTVFLSDAPEAHPEGGHVFYTRGYHRWLDKDAFKKAIEKASTPRPKKLPAKTRVEF